MSNKKRGDGQGQVFFDHKGHRGRFTSYIGFVVAAIVTILISFFVVSVLINPFLPQIRLKPVATLPQAPDTGLPIPEAPTLSRRELQVKQESEKVKLERQKRDDERAQLIDERQLRHVALSATVDQTGVEKPLSVGFFVKLGRFVASVAAAEHKCPGLGRTRVDQAVR